MIGFLMSIFIAIIKNPPWGGFLIYYFGSEIIIKL